MLRQYIYKQASGYTLLYSTHLCVYVYGVAQHMLRLLRSYALLPSFQATQPLPSMFAICSEDLCVSAKVAFQMDLYKNKKIISLAGTPLSQGVQGECAVREIRFL